jgi:hypothetical protein
MTLGAVGNPLFRFSLAGAAKKGEVRSPAQFKGLFKFLGCSTEVFLVEVDFREKPVKGWEILHPEANFVDLIKRFIQHFQPQTELGIEESQHPILRIMFKDSLVDTEEGTRILSAEVKVFQTKDEDDGFESGEAFPPDLPGGSPSSHPEV